MADIKEPMKIAWITGGGTGIGRGLAEALCRRGYRVAISGRRADVLQEAARQIETADTNAEILALPGDITDPVALGSIYAALRDRWGNPDLLVNNAGANSNHSFEDAPPEEFQRYWEVNCLAAIRCTKAVLPEMRKKAGGAIVNIVSIYGKWASAGSASYSVGKYALAGFTDLLRQELVGTGLHVMGVYPGFIKTAMTEPFVKPGSLKRYFGKSPEAMARAILRGLERRAPELFYPWYVPWFLRFHRWMPLWTDRLARRSRRP